MINETVIILAPSDYHEHRLSKYISYLETTFQGSLYFYKPLQEIFSRVLLYDFTKRMTEIGVKGVNEEVIDLVKKEQPKYAIWISKQYEFQESTFESIRKEGTIVVGWFSDDEVRFDDYSKWWIPYLDYCVTGAIEAVPKYRELGARVILAVPLFVGSIPIDCDWSNIEERYDVSFVGCKYLERGQYVNEIKNRNIPIHVFGEGWGRYVSFAEMIDIYGASKINLNFSKTAYNQPQIKGRPFEVCLAGGFLLTEYVPGIENYFDIDKEIVCFHDADEMIDKIIYYLNHEEERRAIAQAGWKRATAEYTSFHVFSRVFDEMEKDIPAKGREGSPHPQQLKMPMPMRQDFSNFHLYWAAGLSLANYKGLWKDALALSISYNPFNIWARLYYIVGFSPLFMRRALFRLYRALRYRLNPIPYLRKMKQSLTKRLFHT